MTMLEQHQRALDAWWNLWREGIRVHVEKNVMPPKPSESQQRPVQN